MDHPPRDQAPSRTSFFQGRALHFFKKLTLHARGSGGKSRDTVSRAAIPTQDCRHTHSSVDLLRKPDMARLIGFRADDGLNPMDADDSSQDASASSNSPHLRPRRQSTLDSFYTAPVHTTFAGLGAASVFSRDKGGPGHKFLLDDAANPLAPTPLFLRSNLSLDAVVQPPQSPTTSPEIPPEIGIYPETKPDERAVRHAPNDDTLQRIGDVLFHDAILTAPMTDPTPPTSSYSGIFPGPRLTPDLSHSSETVQERPLLLSRHTTPLPPPFRVTTERGLRLSPSIITRQPIPLLSLPPLPPPSPAPDLPSRQKVPLRSMPSLSRHGRSNAEGQADHENATLGDSDEEDGDDEEEEGEEEEEEGEEEEPTDPLNVHQSDDEDDELSSAGPSDTQGFESCSQKQCITDDGSLTQCPCSSTPPHGASVGPTVVDCSCSKTYVKPVYLAPSSTSLAMYPFSPNIPSFEDADQRRTLDFDPKIPGARMESRPSLYHATSRSMINLGSSRRTELGPRSRRSRESVRSNTGSISGHAPESIVESEGSEIEAVIGRLLRRTSMPSYQPTSNPPPYPTFNPRPKESRPPAHEDEEREWLPPYSNSLYLIAIMPRKMEFSCPGVQAKDRKWRRVVCELEGTTFRVYKCPPGASGAGVLGDWWERHVGVGDMASPNPPRTRKKEEQFEQPGKLGVDDPPPTLATPPSSSGRSISVPPVRLRRGRSGSRSSMASQSTMTFTPRRAKRTSGASFLSPFRSSSTARPEASTGETSRHSESRELELLPVDAQSSRSSLSHEPVGQATPTTQRSSLPPQPHSASRLSFLPMAAGRSHWRNDEILKPPESDLIRAYTLQHAESGLGNDYLKRKNVIRVRLEGEQFLLQAPDVPAVVEWIEGLHAGTSIALDIDQRPMPRGPMFPRRRRRRARRVQAGEGSGPQPPASRIAA